MGTKPQVRTTLLPGQKGTKQLLKEYGERLVCVRYRYDALRHKRLKTVELIVEEKPWMPQQTIFPDEQKVSIRVGYNENELREQVKAAGGYWDPDRKSWLLSYGMVLSMKLERRIVDKTPGS